MKVIQPRPFNPRKTIFVGTVILILIIVAIRRDPPGPEHIHWTGRTMGTHYDIKIAHSPLSVADSRRLNLEIKNYFLQLNEEMSTYIEDSEISRFNRRADTDPVPVSASFALVTREALHWAERTDGAFDPTLDPLINLWGFGHDASPGAPSEQDIAATLEQIGYDGVRVPDDFHLQKEHPDVQLNLNAIAKGYAVDGVANLIRLYGATNYYVEIGGDLVVSGVNRERMPWRIGVELPDPAAAPGERLHGIAHLSSGAMAGSGNYRQFRIDETGETISHILDPRTGHPVRHDLAGVNVWSETCMVADAIATALIVMGTEEGRAWIEEVPEAEAVFFERADEDTFRAFYSSGFEKVAGYEEMPTTPVSD